MNAHVLIVDDSGFARRTLRQILESAGHTVTDASTGMEALEQYSLGRYDVVLLDIIMDGMSGLEVLGKLRQFDTNARVLLATADTQTATRREAELAGAVGLIQKPFEKEQLLKAIELVASGGNAWN